MESKNKFMLRAIELSIRSANGTGGPFGCLVVKDNKIIAEGSNKVTFSNDPTAHAEMQVLTSACNYLQSKYLDKCTMYTTLEPCVMCAGALLWSKIGKIVYGTRDEKQGAFLLDKNILHPKTKIEGGILMGECAYLLSSFFEKKRKLDKKK